MKYTDPNIYVNCVIQKHNNNNNNSEIVNSVEYNSINISEMVLNIKYHFLDKSYDNSLRLMNINTGWEWSEKYNNIEQLKYRIIGNETFIIAFENMLDNDDGCQYLIHLSM